MYVPIFQNRYGSSTGYSTATTLVESCHSTCTILSLTALWLNLAALVIIAVVAGEVGRLDNTSR
jgi:hypothetical protein